MLVYPIVDSGVTITNRAMCTGSITDETEVSQSPIESLTPKVDQPTPRTLELDPESFLPSLASGMRHRLLKGHLDRLPAVQSRVVRVYISSQFYGMRSISV